MLVLLRHGQSEANAAGELVGRRDPPLTELGSRQAELAGRLLARERTAASHPNPVSVVSSPLRRARATAELVSLALGAREVEIEERLVELDYGALDGLRPAEVDKATWATWRSDPSWSPGGGESLAEVHRRVGSWCDEIAELAEKTDLIAVSHVSPIKAAAGWAIGAGPEIAWRLALGVATLTRISTKPPALHTFGESAHLATGE